MSGETTQSDAPDLRRAKATARGIVWKADALQAGIHRRMVRLSQAPYEAGIETQQLDGVAVKVDSCEKPLADCFKHCGDVGLDSVLEAERQDKAQGSIDVDAILRYADVCRVARAARSYLEALL